MKKSRRGNPFVIPAQAGIQFFQCVMDSRRRGREGLRAFGGAILFGAEGTVQVFGFTFPGDGLDGFESAAGCQKRLHIPGGIEPENIPAEV